jgi:hypothetical protein
MPRGSIACYGVLAVDVGVGGGGVGVEVLEAVGVGVGHGRPSRVFRHPAGALEDGVGAGDVPGDVEGLAGGGVVVDVDVSGAGAGFGPLGPP